MPTGSHVSMTPEELRQGWQPKRIGRRITVLAEVGSTNTHLLELAGEPDADGLVLLADSQTHGRGRLGRSWLSPRRAGVLCSVLLFTGEDEKPSIGPVPPRPACSPETLWGGWLTLVSAVAACEAIHEATDVNPAIRWPNDILASGRKLGGVLIESRSISAGRRAWVVGIGINCAQHQSHFPPELSDSATSLEIEASHGVDRLTVARSLLQRLDAWLGGRTSPGGEEAHAAWLHWAEPIGRRARLRCGQQVCAGRIIAVDPAGGLILQPDVGRQQWFDPMTTTLLP